MHTQRWSWWLLVSISLLVFGCEKNDRAPAIKKDYTVRAVAARTYVIEGPLALPNKDNQGFMHNAGFVVTDKGVVVIDPGGSVQIGEMLLKKIRGVTQAPVLAVFNTHVHGDHWLGNQAIRAAFPKAVIYAHENMRAKVKAGEGENWVGMMMQMTEGAVKGTQPLAPDIALADGDVLTIGNTHFRALHTGRAHTDGDLMIEVVEDGVVFMGDILFNGRLPRLDDGSFAGNIKALERALQTAAKVFVPGHGAPGDRAVPTNFRNFLLTVRDTVKKQYAAGTSDFDAKPAVVTAAAPWRQWVGFDDGIGKLVSLAYLEAEQEDFK